jgi:hypothetical protein
MKRSALFIFRLSLFRIDLLWIATASGYGET